MKYLFCFLLMPVLLLFNITEAQDTGSENKNQVREVVVTFDDLPGVDIPVDTKELKENTKKLLSAVSKHKVPAIGFVNEGKLYESGKYIKERAQVLKMWLDKGMDLGNHTFSHGDINTMPLAEFEEDVIKGEATVKKLLNEKGMKLNYFRHPFLHVGKGMENRKSFEDFLSKRGYTVAPVTIDNSEWIFARAYKNAKQKGDKDLMKKIAEAYVPYMEQKFEYFEKQCAQLFGREIKQVLLIHANDLNADHFDDLAKMLEKRGYKFVSLGEALKDSAYQSPDTYAGAGGITWIHRWAITRKVNKDFYKGEPSTPEFVMKEAGVTEE